MRKIKLQRRDVIDLHNAVIGAANVVKGGDYKLVWALDQTRKSLRAMKDSIEAAQEASPEYTTFDRLRIELAEELAVQENGKPKHDDTDNSIIIDPQKMGEWRQRFRELQEKHAPAIAAHRERQRTFNKFMAEEVEVEVQRFPRALLPMKDIPALFVGLMRPLFIDDKEPDGMKDEDEQTA